MRLIDADRFKDGFNSDTTIGKTMRLMIDEQPTVDVLEQDKIICKVLEERKRQDAKWGEQNHSAYMWASIIGEEYGEMCKAINEFGFNPTPEMEQDIYTEAIHTMASCMAMLECMERNRAAAQNNNKEDLESGRLIT